MQKNKINVILMSLLGTLIIWQFTDMATKIETNILQTIARIREVHLTQWIIYLTNSVSIVYYSLVLIILISIYYIKQRRIPWLLPLPLLLSSIIFYVMKIIIHRPRPVTMSVIQHDFSFPSGHTLSAIVIVYTVWMVITKLYPNKQHYMTIIIGMVYTIAIMITRLYLGVHYPSDILASIIIGSLIIVNSYSYLSKKL